MSKKEFLKLLQDPEVKKAIREIIAPEVSEHQTKEISSLVLNTLNEILANPISFEAVVTQVQS